MKSAAEVATDLGVSRRTVLRIAKQLGITKRWHMLLLDEQQQQAIKAACRGKVGNPNFTAGNYFGKPSKPKKTTRKRKAQQ